MSIRPARAVALLACTGGLLLAVAGCDAGADPGSGATPSGSFATLAGPSPTFTDSVVGGFAPGIPALLQQLPDGAKVLVTSARNESRDKVTVSVSLSSTGEPAAALDYYQRLASEAGFAPAESEQGDALTATFAKAKTGEYFTVAVVPAEGGASITLYGSFIPDLD